MSYIRIWVHCVWATKNIIPYLREAIRGKVIHHILENARMKDIYILRVNGYTEHLHALISLGGKQSISDVMHKIKGESSHWINKNKLTSRRFEWQDDFWSISIGEADVPRVRQYIECQETHHKKVTATEELDKLIIEFNKRVGD